MFVHITGNRNFSLWQFMIKNSVSRNYVLYKKIAPWISLLCSHSLSPHQKILLLLLQSSKQFCVKNRGFDWKIRSVTRLQNMSRIDKIWTYGSLSIVFVLFVKSIFIFNKLAYCIIFISKNASMPHVGLMSISYWKNIILFCYKFFIILDNSEAMQQPEIIYTKLCKTGYLGMDNSTRIRLKSESICPFQLFVMRMYWYFWNSVTNSYDYKLVKIWPL